jgi:hypothetical protein
MRRKDETLIRPRLETLMKQYDLDFVTVLDKGGRVFARARPPYNRGDLAFRDGMVEEAMKGKEAKGTVIIEREVLELEGEGHKG